MGKNIILVDSNALPAASVNEMGMQRVASDNTPANTTSTTYATLATIAVPATEVIHHIMIQTTMIVSGAYNSAGPTGHTSFIDIHIGEGGSEVTKYAKQIGFSSIGVASSGGRTMTTISFYYEPTTAEKTNGFNVIIKGKSPDHITGAGNYVGYDKCDIFAG